MWRRLPAWLAAGLLAIGALEARAFLRDVPPRGRANDRDRAVAAQASPSPIVIDGWFGDWSGIPAAAADPADAPDAPVDFGQIKAAHDDEAIYLLVDLGRPVNAQAVPGTISLIFDADADAGTGGEAGGLAGADLVVDLSPYYGVGGLPPGIGVGVRTAAAPRPRAGAGPGAAPLENGRVPFERKDSYDVGFVFAPKFTSRLIEVRLQRTPGGGLPGFGEAGYAAKLVFTDRTGAVRDEVGPFEYRMVFGSPAHPGPEEAADPLARLPGASFRVLSWNVSEGNLVERTDVFRRIIEAAEPDLLLLDEVKAGLSADSIRALLFGRGEAEEWAVAYGEAGGRQRGVIAVRGGALLPAPKLARVEYPPDLMTRLGGSRPLGFGGTGDGVPAAAAVVRIEGRRLLAVTVDLQCCGNGAHTPEETVRIAEARALAASIRAELEAQESRADAVVVAGDFNLVGSREPLVLLASGSDPDGSDLAVSHPLGPRGLTDATWSGARAARAFPPGRLDFLLYSDSSLGLERAFVLDTAELPARWLARYGLEPEDSARASDHFPLVADLAWVETDS